jgi:hypothetical protein
MDEREQIVPGVGGELVVGYIGKDVIGEVAGLAGGGERWRGAGQSSRSSAT